MNSIPISMYCPYCKKHTSLTVALTYFKDEYYNRIIKIECEWKRSSNSKWWIGICNYCKKPVLVHNYGDIIYPKPLPSPSDVRIPENIRKDLDEAKSCLSIKAFRACAVMARRAIQSACIDKGASKDKLKNQLEKLYSQELITKDIKEWADVVRWVGNDAAHPESQEVLEEDAKDILHLAEQFLHVLYVTPSIAKERKTKRGK